MFSTNPSWTAVTLVELSPESTTKAVDLPVAKQERTGVLRKKIFATPNFSKAILAIDYLWASNSAWVMLKLASSLKSNE